MINLAYIIMGYILAFEVVFFLLLALPTPQWLKGRIVNAILNSRFIRVATWGYIALIIIAGMFFAELYQTEKLYNQEKEAIRVKSVGNVGTGNTYL